jgi:hypothetical protein
MLPHLLTSPRHLRLPMKVQGAHGRLPDRRHCSFFPVQGEPFHHHAPGRPAVPPEQVSSWLPTAAHCCCLLSHYLHPPPLSSFVNAAAAVCRWHFHGAGQLALPHDFANANRRALLDDDVSGGAGAVATASSVLRSFSNRGAKTADQLDELNQLADSNRDIDPRTVNNPGSGTVRAATSNAVGEKANSVGPFTTDPYGRGAVLMVSVHQLALPTTLPLSRTLHRLHL